MPVEPSTVSSTSLLAEHHGDVHAALATLVSRFNRGAAEHAALRQEHEAAVQASERAAQENQQLWRSLKALSSASPRPSALRQNSDHSAPQGVRGLALDSPTSRGLRGGASGDSNTTARLDLPSMSASGGAGGSGGSGANSQHSSPRGDLDFDAAFLDPTGSSNGGGSGSRSAEPSPRFPSAVQFSPIGRSKAATPPPSHGSPRQYHLDALSSSALRKANSLDLGRGAPDAAAAGAEASGLSSSPTEALTMPHHDVLPRTPTQEKAFDPRRRRSSPRIMTASSSMPMLLDPALDRRVLPLIQPVSPFSLGVEEGGSRSIASRNSISASSAAGEHLQQQMRQSSGRTAELSAGSSHSSSSSRRDRTFSSNASSAASLATAFPEVQQQPPSRSSSSHAMAQEPNIGLAASPSSPSSGGVARERRPSAPNSRLAHATHATHDSDATIATISSASASRRPSGMSIGTGGSSTVVPPSLRTPTARFAATLASQPPAPTLRPTQLANTRVRVTSSNLRLSERGKEILSFVIDVEVGASPSVSSAARDQQASSEAPTRWRVEKKYADILGLDALVRNKASRSETKAMASLPDKSLFKDHAPHKSDQRKALLERYLQTLLSIPLKDRASLCTFLMTDVVPMELPKTPLSAHHGAMEGWLTKKGRNFGGWQTRFYVLSPGRALAYYDVPGGTKLGEIPLQSAAIGRQSSSRSPAATSAGASNSGSHGACDGATGDGDAYLHAFLIRTQGDDKHGQHEADHILCAESDELRDRWVQALTTLQSRTGTSGGSAAETGKASNAQSGERALPQTPTATVPSTPTTLSFDADPFPPTFQSAAKERRRSGSGPASSTSAAAEHGLSVRAAGELPPSVSLPSDLHALARGMPALEGGAGSQKIGTISESGEGTGASSGAGASSTASSSRSANKLQAPSSRRPSADRPLSPLRTDSPNPAAPPPVPAPPAATKYSASDVSGPMNAVPLPSGYDFKKAERQKKTKSSFWNFASRNSSNASSADKNAGAGSNGQQQAAAVKPVFGVPLSEAVAISRIRPGLELPAIVYRCVEYLEAKNAEHEEGIFRLSGSANVIRLLKERFNAEGDVNLLQSAEYYDPHAIAGLLKQYLRELPDHLLTRELHTDFLRVIDFRDRRDRVNALGKLVARLPIEEYTLFRFFFAHLCLIAQNADTSKMNLRNLGIVFAPTLAIPQPLFSLFLVEFDLIFAVETETGAARPIMVGEDPTTLDDSTMGRSPSSGGGNRNSQLYEASGAGELERKLEKLREHDEGDDDLTGDMARPAENDLTETDVTARSVDDSSLQDPQRYPVPSIFVDPALASPALGSQLRSPGLPASPRPGATF